MLNISRSLPSKCIKRACLSLNFQAATDMSSATTMCFDFNYKRKAKRVFFWRRLMQKNFSTDNCHVSSAEDFSNIIKDSVTEKKVKLILMEFTLQKQVHDELPEKLSERDMLNLLDIPSDIGRRNYIVKYLHKRHVYKLAKEKRKTEALAQRNGKIEVKTYNLDSESSDHIVYGLSENSIHFRIRKDTISNFYAHRLAQSAMFGQPLVFDCGFSNQMNKKERWNTAIQLQYSYGVNITNRDPFDLYFCNVGSHADKHGLVGYLEKAIPNLHYPRSMISVTDKNYLEIFSSKRECIYLSPDAPEFMNTFDHDAVYIIGALADLGASVPHTLAKAKREGIRCLKLPLDKHLLFKPGACKSLPMIQIFQILLELRSSGDWTKALSHIPKRAVLSAEEINARSAQRFKKNARSRISLHDD